MTANTPLSEQSLHPVTQERRRGTRVAHVMEAYVNSPTATDDSERMAVETLNLSRYGVGFTLRRSLPTQAYYVIEIGVGSQRLVSEVRIVSCRKVGSSFEIGAEFH